MLHGDTSVPVTYMVFDVLACEGLATTMLPYSERRALLDELDLRGSPLLQVGQDEEPDNRRFAEELAGATRQLR